GPARITAAYAFEDLSGRREDKHYGGSLIYSVNKTNKVSVAYVYGESKCCATREIESDVFTACWEHNMGKGVSFAASVFKAETGDRTTCDAADNDGGIDAGAFILRVLKPAAGGYPLWDVRTSRYFCAGRYRYILLCDRTRAMCGRHSWT